MPGADKLKAEAEHCRRLAREADALTARILLELAENEETNFSHRASDGGNMSTAKEPLKPDDFPVHGDGEEGKKQDGEPIADTKNPAVADDIADRLNEDEARREDDKWSA